MSERESRPGESGPFVSLDEVPVAGGTSGGLYGTLLSEDIIPTGGGPRVDKIHGVLTDDPQLLSAVVKAIDGDDGAAVLIIAEKFHLSGVEAGEVLAAVLGDGKRPAGCFLNKRGRLEVMATAEEMLRSVDRMSSAFHRTIPLDGFGVDPEAEKRVDALMSRHMAGWKTYPLTLDTPSLTGLTLTMPSATHPSGVRSLSLEEIDEVFSALDEERRQTGEDQEDRAETLAWMRRALARLDTFESTFLAVNELCPPSDWLRDLKAASHDPDALVELLRRATAARAEKDRAGAEAATVADRHNCRTCAHGGQFACNLFGSMRSEALTWRASNTTGDGCPGWEGKATGEGFQTPSAPAQPSPVMFCGDGTALDLDAKPPTFKGMAKLRDDGFLQELNRLVLHPAGLALALTQEDDGRVVDVTVMETEDPAGWSFGFEHMSAYDCIHASHLTATVAKAIQDRAQHRLNDPDLKAVIEPQPVHSSPSWERVTGLIGIDAQALRTAAQSFILADTCLDATPYEKGAHDAATAILRGDLSTGDPRVTLRGQVEEARQTARALESTLAQVKAERDRALAVLAAETGKQGLPGWTWENRERQWYIYYRERAVKLTAWGTTILSGPGFHARIGIKAITSGGHGLATDALNAMEKATAWARVRGYTGEAPDLEAIVPVQARTEIAHLWEQGAHGAAVEVYRSCFLEHMAYNEACNALDLYFESKPKAEPTTPGPV